MDQEGRWQAWVLRSWHLAILRFAVTREHADRLGVLAIAHEIDRLHEAHDERADFEFFRRISTDLCEAILYPNKDANGTLLRQYLARVSDTRLENALRAVISVEDQQAPAKRPSKSYRDIWRGLSSRHNT